MRVSHATTAVFDDPNLVSCVGLAPVLTLAERCGLPALVAHRFHIHARSGASPEVKVPALVAGIVAGADCIDGMDLLRHDGMDLLRHGGMGRLFGGGVRAPSTLGTFLRCFTFGHVRQLDGVASRLLVNLACHTPILAGAEQVALVGRGRHHAGDWGAPRFSDCGFCG